MDTHGEQEVSRLRYDDKINRLDTSAINEGTFACGRPVCNSRANEMKIRYGDINYFSDPRQSVAESRSLAKRHFQADRETFQRTFRRFFILRQLALIAMIHRRDRFPLFRRPAMRTGNAVATIKCDLQSWKIAGYHLRPFLRP